VVEYPRGEPLSGKREEIGRGGEIALGPEQALVAQVDGEEWQPGVEIDAGAIPRGQAVHGEGVALIPRAE